MHFFWGYVLFILLVLSLFFKGVFVFYRYSKYSRWFLCGFFGFFQPFFPFGLLKICSTCLDSGCFRGVFAFVGSL